MPEFEVNIHEPIGPFTFTPVEVHHVALGYTDDPMKRELIVMNFHYKNSSEMASLYMMKEDAEYLLKVLEFALEAQAKHSPVRPDRN